MLNQSNDQFGIKNLPWKSIEWNKSKSKWGCKDISYEKIILRRYFQEIQMREIELIELVLYEVLLKAKWIKLNEFEQDTFNIMNHSDSLLMRTFLIFKVKFNVSLFIQYNVM